MTEKTSRQDKGQRTGIYMALGNLCLFIGYFSIGMIGNSIAVLSEGVDNLIDACSSLLLLLGFKISGRGKDSRHPNGHGRIEYIVGLLISEMVLFASISLGIESIRRLFRPEPVGALLPILLAAVIGAGVKLAMAACIEKQNKELKSPALEAYRKNALADLKGIILVAVSPILQHLTTLPVDGIAGIIVAVMIAADGIKSFLKNASLLLGEGLDKEETEEISQILRPYGDGLLLESFELHDYGPEEKDGVMVLSVSPGVNFSNLQLIMNDCKEQIKKKLNIQVSIYLNLNKAKMPDRNFVMRPHLGDVRQYLKLLIPDMRRGRRA